MSSSGISKSSRFSSVVGEATVARLLSPVPGMLLGTGSDMLKKSTTTFVKTSLVNYV